MRREEIKQEVIDFVIENEDIELSNRMLKKFVDEATEENDMFDTRKTLCSLARAVAMFMCMCKMSSTDDKISIEDCGNVFSEIFNFYCFGFGRTANEESL